MPDAGPGTKPDFEDLARHALEDLVSQLFEDGQGGRAFHQPGKQQVLVVGERTTESHQGIVPRLRSRRTERVARRMWEPTLAVVVLIDGKHEPGCRG